MRDLSLSSKDTKKSSRRLWATVNTRAWMWELCALVGSFALFAILVALLVVFNGKTIFQWEGITLNTIVSTVSTAFKALLLFPITECVGQWKWILSREERALMDFERLDQATRGPFGSFYLIWRRNVPFILRSGLVVIVLSLAVDPFSQQLIQLENTIYYMPSFEGRKATTSWIQKYDNVEANVFSVQGHHVNATYPGATDHVTWEMPLALQSAILNGISQPKEDLQQLSNVKCPTANCTWDPFETLGVCHRCNNLTPELRTVGNLGQVFNHLRYFDLLIGTPPAHRRWPELNVTAFSLPNGHLIPNVDGCDPMGNPNSKDCFFYDGHPSIAGQLYEKKFWQSTTSQMTSFGTGDPNKTNSMHGLDTMIWSESVIYTEKPDTKASNAWPNSRIQAQECALYYCVKTVRTSVENNVLKEAITFDPNAVRNPNSWKINDKSERFKWFPPENIPKNLDSLEFDHKTSACPITDLKLWYPERPDKPQFSITAQAVLSISAFFQDTLRYQWKHQDYEKALKLIRGLIPDAKVVFNGLTLNHVPQPNILKSAWGKTNTSIEDDFERLALSMTNAIRRHGQEAVDPFIPMVDVSRTYQSPVGPQVGRIGVNSTVYSSEWYWMFLHGIVLLISTAFCLVTMAKSGGGMAGTMWKNHSLAAIRRGAVDGHVLYKATTVQEMEELARQTSMPILSGEGLPSRHRSGGGSIGEEVSVHADDVSRMEEGGRSVQSVQTEASEEHRRTSEIEREAEARQARDSST